MGQMNKNVKLTFLILTKINSSVQFPQTPNEKFVLYNEFCARKGKPTTNEGGFLFFSSPSAIAANDALNWRQTQFNLMC